MWKNDGQRGALIIGAGLVGGAVLREIVLGSVRRRRGRTAPCLDKSAITARSGAKLIRQIRKTKRLLRV